jgi:ACT domain-containing protein
MKASATASIHGVMREEENRAITSKIKTKDRYGRMAKRVMIVEQLFASILSAPQHIIAANCVSTMRLNIINQVVQALDVCQKVLPCVEMKKSSKFCNVLTWKLNVVKDVEIKNEEL